MEAKHEPKMKQMKKKHEADMCPKKGKKCADEGIMKRGYK